MALGTFLAGSWNNTSLKAFDEFKILQIQKYKISKEWAIPAR